MLFVIDFKSIFVSAHLDRSLTIAKEEIEQHAQCTLGKQKSAATEVNYLPRNTFLSYDTLHVRYVTLRHVMLRYVMSRYVMSRHVTSCYVMLGYITYCISVYMCTVLLFF